MALQTPVELVPQTDTFDQWRQKTNNVIDQSNQTVLDVGDLTTLTTSTQDNIVEAINALNTNRTLTLTGDVAGNVTFDGEGPIVLNTTVVHDSVVLGVDTIGEYVSGINSALRTIDVELCQPGVVFCVKLLTPGSGYNYPTTTAIISAPEELGGVTATADVILSGSPVTSIVLTYGGTGYFIDNTTISISEPDIPTGTQATASLTLGGGIVNTLFLTNAGSGYTNASVSFSSPDVVGGTLPTASVTFSGAPVTLLTLDEAGSGYTNVSVSFSAPEKSGGVTATATAQLSGAGVTQLDLIDGGSGYTVGTNSVTISNPEVAGGVAATASVTLSGASVLEINMTNNGTAYTTANVAISAPDVVGGTQATGDAVFSGAGVVGCYIGLIGGSGYHAADTTVTFSSPEKLDGITAEAYAVVVDGVITEIVVTNEGSGYLNAPTVTIVDSHPTPGTGAVAIAIIGKFTITDVTITNAGSGYLNPPTVTITGDGVQAAATATIGTSTITSINLLTAGSGYLSAPTVTITGNGTDAEATATVGTSSVTGVTLTNQGSGYLNPPTVTITGDGTDASASATIGTFSIDTITLDTAGSGYLYNPTVNINGDGTNATASTTIGGSTVATVTLDEAGSGYLIPPTVTISGSGTDATVISTIGTSTVTDIIITNGGSGYLTQPTITIVDSNAVPGTGATALVVVSDETSKVNLDLPETGVTAGTYGNTTQVGTFTVDNYGRLTNASNLNIEVMPTGSIGQVPFVSTNNTYQYEADFTLKTGLFVESDIELDSTKSSVIPSNSIYNSWLRFSHDGSATQPADLSETLSWQYNAITEQVECTINSGTYIGFISENEYDTYLHEVRLSSANSDDDVIAVVIAWYVDPVTNRENTLSAVRSPGGVNFTWQIIYNYNRSDQKVIYDGNQYIRWGNGNYGATPATSGYVTNQTVGGWDDFNPIGTKVKITRTGDTILCQTTELGSQTYVAAADIIIDLNSDPDLLKFKGARAYGYSCNSQALSTFNVIQFVVNDTIYDTRDGSVWKFINGVWVLSPTLTIWGDKGVGRLLSNQETKKTYYTDSPNSVIKVFVSTGNTVIKKDITIAAGSYYELDPFTEFGLSAEIEAVTTNVRVLDNVVSSPTYNMKINSEAVASVAYTSETIRVYNDYTSSLVFDIILKL